MSIITPSRSFAAEQECHAVDVSVVMPCLNEIISLPHCIGNAREALAELYRLYGLTGEILVADNGSSDGSQQLAQELGARVVAISERGYGAALIGGCHAAAGRYILMADADGSYNFLDGVEMVARLHKGAELCMGSRFKGQIAAGAMPWKNRYIGNPVLTGILNLFFRSGISDAHCGLRAIRKQAFEDLGLSSRGMEFASEMVIKAALRKMHIAEVPASLSPDLRDRPPHLRPWRDGWRHLRYLMMLSPTWVFGVPSLLAILAASAIFVMACLQSAGLAGSVSHFGTGWTVVAGYLLTLGHLSAVMALATHFHGVRRGYRNLRPSLARWSHVLTLETSLIAGTAITFAAMLGIAFVGIRWTLDGFAQLPSTLPLIVAASLGAVGVQTILGGFLLSIIGGHDAQFGSSLGKGA